VSYVLCLKIPLPPSLCGKMLPSSMTFCSVSSRPATLAGLPKDTLGELVRSLISTVHKNFQTCLSPENYLVRELELEAVEMDICEQRYILLGVSNLGYCAAWLRHSGRNVVDLTTPGWVASPENIKELVEKLEKTQCGEKDILVLDLFGNMSYRFEPFDGTLSLPFKSNGNYHLAGKVVVCPTATFKKTLEKTANLLAWKNSTCIVIPPLPPYVFSGCCPQEDHCTNVGKTNHERLLMAEIIGLRNMLKRFVANLGTGRSRVLDCCCVTDCTTTANIDTRIEALRRVTASDGIHYQSSGYENLVKSILGVQQPAKQMVNSSQTTKLHFWRGFRSQIVSNTTVSAVNPNHGGVSSCRPTRGRLQRGKWYSYASHAFHPYKKN
jgi:hypothetical protein